jgi:4-amino-4-deoxy-L-arabinose transferase-like glycosyltransferase
MDARPTPPGRTRGLPWEYGVAILVSAFLFLPGIFLRDFWIYDEGRRALVALEMVQRGDWLVPRLIGTPLLIPPAR